MQGLIDDLTGGEADGALCELADDGSCVPTAPFEEVLVEIVKCEARCALDRLPFHMYATMSDRTLVAGAPP